MKRYLLVLYYLGYIQSPRCWPDSLRGALERKTYSFSWSPRLSHCFKKFINFALCAFRWSFCNFNCSLWVLMMKYICLTVISCDGHNAIHGFMPISQKAQSNHQHCFIWWWIILGVVQLWSCCMSICLCIVTAHKPPKALVSGNVYDITRVLFYSWKGTP